MLDERRRNIAIGVVGLSAGAAFAGAAAWAFTVILEMQADTTPAIEDYRKQCMEVAEELELDPNQDKPQSIVLEHDSAQKGILQLSTLQGFCPTYKLESMCAGAECRSPFQAILKQRSDIPGIDTNTED